LNIIEPLAQTLPIPAVRRASDTVSKIGKPGVTARHVREQPLVP
jgi:hypothetical protein